jgi:homoserine kinase type II
MAEVENMASLLQWLSSNHFPTSSIFKTAAGNAVTEYAGKPVVIKKWIPGEVHKNFSDEQLRQTGKAMAELHKFPAPGYLSDIHPYGRQIFLTDIKKGIDTTYENWLEERIQFLKINLPKNLPRGLVHGDIYFDNVLFENDELKAIIDFKDVSEYYLVFELGMGSLGLCRSEYTIDLSKVKALVEGYEQVRSLETSEKESLKVFIEFAAISTSWWRYWKYNIQSPTPHLKKKHMDLVKVAKWLEKVEKEHFLTVVFCLSISIQN